MSTRQDAVLTDAAIIAASRRDPRRFAEIFDRHWPRVQRYCINRAGPAGEDIAAETFRVALDARRRYDVAYESAGPWLFGIATNLLRSSLRAETRRARALGRMHLGPEADHAETALDRLEADALGARVAAALGQMPAIYRETVLLHAWGELSYEEVAVALDISVATVRTRIHRARTHIRETVQLEELC